MKKQRFITLVALCGMMLLTVQCTQKQEPPPDTRAADEAALRKADVDWSNAAEAKQMDTYYGFFLSDAVVLAPNEAMMNGMDAIRKSVGAMFAMPGFNVKWQLTKVEVARSGDIGYTLGTYELTMNDPKGKPMTDKGKYATIWKKQTDGSWKVAVDMFNTDMPVPQPPSKSK